MRGLLADLLQKARTPAATQGGPPRGLQFHARGRDGGHFCVLRRRRRLRIHRCQGRQTDADGGDPETSGHCGCAGRDDRLRQRQIKRRVGENPGHLTPTCAPWSQLRSRSGVTAMQALTLMVVYALTTISVQFLGFLISRLVDYEWPTLGLMTFLILFMAAFGIAWPIAVRVAEFLIRRSGHTVETAQSGGYVVEELKTRRAAS